MDRATVLIIDHTEGNLLKERMEKRPEFLVVGSTNTADIGFTLAEHHQPKIILLNVDLPGNDGFELAEIFAQEFPMSSLVLLTSSDNKRVLRLALQVGAKDVINLPVDDAKLHAALQRVSEQDRKLTELYSVQRRVRPQFRTVTVFSTKGGVGKTTVALNLALALRKASNKRVVLVDLDLYSGNVALMAGVTPSYSLKDLVDELNNVDNEALDAYCTDHPSGLKILAAPAHPEVAGFIGSDQVEAILSRLSQVFNYVVVDAPTYFHDTVIPALEMAQDIVLVTTLDLASVQNLKQCLGLLDGLSVRSKARIVVNKMGFSGGLRLQDVEDDLGLSAQCVIPNVERLAVNAVNMGDPLLLSAKTSVAARRIEELAGKLLHADDHHARGPQAKSAG